MADGTLLLAKEDRVDYYYKLLTRKVKSTTELNVVDLRSRQADIVEGMNVIALGRLFFTYSLCDYTGELYLKYPYFGCNELLTSTCRTSEVFLDSYYFMIVVRYVHLCIICALFASYVLFLHHLWLFLHHLWPVLFCLPKFSTSLCSWHKKSWLSLEHIFQGIHVNMF